MVSSAEEYQAYVKECLDWAKMAETERERATPFSKRLRPSWRPP